MYVWGMAAFIYVWGLASPLVAQPASSDEGGDEPIASPPVQLAIPATTVRAFAPMGASEAVHKKLHEQMRLGAIRYAANHSETFDVVTAEEVVEAVRDQAVFRQKLEVAEGWADQGIDAYKSLNFREAIDKFEKAVANYSDIQYHLVAPRRVAEVMMYLSLSYLSTGGNAARPLTLIRRMVMLQPSRVLQRGYYPGDIVSFYESTRRDSLARLRDRGPAESRAELIAETTESRFVTFAYAFPLDGGPRERVDEVRYEVGLWLYDTNAGEFLEVRRIGAPASGEPGVEAGGLRGAVNRLVSRVASCVYEPPDPTPQTLVRSSGKSPFSVDIGIGYLSYLRYPEPIDRPFGNIGFDFGAQARLTREFSIVLGGQVLSSLRDYSGRLVDGFTTLRFYGGPDIGVQIGPVNLGGHLALEVAGTGDFAVCTSLDALATGCEDPSNRRTFGDHVMAGISARPRVRVELVPSFSLRGGASISYYVLPFPERRLGFPVSFDFGVKYRF
jgi:hypothetical protein